MKIKQINYMNINGFCFCTKGTVFPFSSFPTFHVRLLSFSDWNVLLPLIAQMRRKEILLVSNDQKMTSTKLIKLMTPTGT